MDKAEALFLAEQQIARLRDAPYAELKQRVEKRVIDTPTVIGPSGTKYQLEVQALWDNRSKTNIRVMVAIDDGGWRAFYPLTRDFIKAPDGSFVGE